MYLLLKVFNKSRRKNHLLRLDLSGKETGGFTRGDSTPSGYKIFTC